MPTMLMPSRRAADRPNATIAIGVVTALVFLLECFLGHDLVHGSEDSEVLVRLGASWHPLVFGAHHQLYRLLCPAFLHIGWMHILANGYAFLQLAPFVERVWGSSRFLIVYLVSAFAGCFASALFGHSLSAGASGAIFGLIGFLLSAGWNGRQRYEVRTLVKTYFGQVLVLWAGFNLYIGFQQGSHVDNLGHLGGLVAGLILGTFLTGVITATAPVRAVAAACVLATAASFVASAIHGRRAVELVRNGDDERTPFEEAFAKAVTAFKAHDHQAAVRYSELAIHLAAPGDEAVVGAYSLDAIALRALGRLDDAKVSLEVSFSSWPLAQTAMSRAEIALLTSDAKGAVEWSDKAAQCAPGRHDPGPLLAMAGMLADRGHPIEARDALERARRLAPGAAVLNGQDVAALESRLGVAAAPK